MRIQLLLIALLAIGLVLTGRTLRRRRELAG